MPEAGSGITIYHNLACGTSRNVLGLIRDSGVEPRIVEYLETPPSREELVDLVRRMGIPVRDLLRRKGTPYDELGLDDPAPPPPPPFAIMGLTQYFWPGSKLFLFLLFLISSWD